MSEPPATAFGLTVAGMPEDVSPLAALTVMKALDADGDLCYWALATEGVSTVEALGMAEYACVRLRAALAPDGE